jgi:hypothetical protein
MKRLHDPHNRHPFSASCDKTSSESECQRSSANKHSSWTEVRRHAGAVHRSTPTRRTRRRRSVTDMHGHSRAHGPAHGSCCIRPRRRVCRKRLHHFLIRRAIPIWSQRTIILSRSTPPTSKTLHGTTTQHTAIKTPLQLGPLRRPSNLLPYFSGSLAITNNGGNSGEVQNCLDGGGASPLMMNMAANGTSSNQ